MGNLLTKIKEDFKKAYKERNMDVKNYLGFLISEVTKESKTPDNAYIISKFKTMVKNGEETNSMTNKELNVISEYIPVQMSTEDLTKVINNFIIELEGTPKKHIGLIMNHLKTEHSGKYDGKIAADIIKKL